MLLSAGLTDVKKYDAFHSQRMNDVTGCVIFATMNLEQAIAVNVPNVLDTQALVMSCGIGNRRPGWDFAPRCS